MNLIWVFAVALVAGIVYVALAGDWQQRWQRLLWCGLPWGASAAMAAIYDFRGRPDHLFFGLLVVVFLSVISLFARAARRVVVRAAFVALPVGLVASGIYAYLVQMSPNGELSADIQRGLATGGVIAIGWIVTFAIQELRSEQVRRASEIELMTALFAEIDDARSNYSKDDLRADGEKVASRIEDGDGQSPYFPFVTTPKQSVLFDSVASQLHTLPRKPLFHIVAYYTQAKDVRNMATDLQRPEFRDLAPETRAKAYRDFVSLQIKAAELADTALDAIIAELPFNQKTEKSSTRDATNPTKKPEGGGDASS